MRLLLCQILFACQHSCLHTRYILTSGRGGRTRKVHICTHPLPRVHRLSVFHLISFPLLLQHFVRLCSILYLLFALLLPLSQRLCAIYASLIFGFGFLLLHSQHFLHDLLTMQLSFLHQLQLFLIVVLTILMCLKAMWEVILRNHTYTREGFLWRHAWLLWADCEVLDWWWRLCYLDRSWLLKFGLSSFLPCLDSEGSQCLVMLARRGRFDITLCATIPHRIVKNDLCWHVFKALNLPRFHTPLRGIHHTEIALSLVREVKDELPLIDCRVKLRFFCLLPQVRIAEIERCKSKLWWRFDDWVVRGIQVNCAAIRIDNKKTYFFKSLHLNYWHAT